MSVFKRYNGKRITSSDPNWSKGTWYIYKRLPGQKPIQKAVPEAKTEKQALQAELNEITKAFNKKYGEAPQITFHEFADSTYRDYIEQRNVNKVAKLADLEIFLKFFGKKKLIGEITVKDCRDLQYQLMNRKKRRGEGVWSPSTVNRTMVSLSKIFTLACEEEILKRNPMQHVASLDEPPPRLRLLTDEQKERFWAEVLKDTYMFRIVMLGVNMPVRRGQIVALKKEDIDLENRTAFVIGSKGRKPRPVPLNNAALKILTDMCSEVESGPLILFEGKPIHNFRTRWDKLLVRCGINKKGGTREENFHFHDLRTEFGSQLLRNNVNPEVIRRLYAHSTMQITQGYMSTDFDQLLHAVEQLDPPNVINSEVVQ